MEQKRKEKIRNIPVLRFWESWDDEERRAAVRIAGIALAVCGIFLLFATSSYLFNWKRDFSVISEAGAQALGEEVGNSAGSFGARIGKFLICDLFGLGAYALILILFVFSARLVADKCKGSVLRICILSVSGAFVTSLLLAYIGSLIGLDNAFGGGLGGNIGALISDWCSTRFGMVPTLLFILVITLCWLFFCSKAFDRWIARLGTKKSKEPEERRARIRAERGDSINGGAATEDEDSGFGTVDSRVDEAAGDAIGDINGGDTKDAAEDAAEDAARDAAASQHTDLQQFTGTGAEIKEQFDPANAQEEGVPGEGGDTAGQEVFGCEVIVAGNLSREVTRDLPPIDNKLDAQFGGLQRYQMPSLDLLEMHNSGKVEVSSEELSRNNNKIRTTLKNYKIDIVDVTAIMGPTVTLYKVYPAPGVQIAQIKRLQDDIGISLAAKGVRVVTLSDSVGIEVANDKSSIVSLKSLLNDRNFRESKAELPVAIGYTITQEVKVFDLADAPHLLIAGATKQGKSVGLNVIINSLLYSKHPSELKFVFVDPKSVEFASYSNLLHHYLAVMPDATDDEDEKNKAIVKKAPDAERVLRSLCIEMDERYELIAKSGVSNIKSYNEKFRNRKLNPNNGHRFLPYIVTIVDEYADLTMSTGASPEARAASRSITNSIIRLAQKGRAAGLHVILATQRPSVDVISGLIKSNFPMRIAFRVASRTDSMTILDNPGAEKLIGRGDMLLSTGIDMERIQCAYISPEEIEKVNDFVGSQEGFGRCYSTPYYLPSIEENEETESGGGSGEIGTIDARFEEAARLVVTTQRGSTSDLQRRLGMGYAKAGRVMDQLEKAGIVGPQDGSKPRQILVGDLDTLQQILDKLGI